MGNMKKAWIYILFFVLVIPVTAEKSLSSRVKTFTLTNGMTFFVYERHALPTFAGAISVKVGSVDEKEGQTGLAHMFEHLAFKGTPVIGTRNYGKEKVILEQIDALGQTIAEEYRKGENADTKLINDIKDQIKKLQEQQRQYTIKDQMAKLYAVNGGRDLNALTSRDTTEYFVSLPVNRLELWFLLESERFKYPVFRDFYVEKEVIAAERKEGEQGGNKPLTDEFLHAAFFSHPYRHPTIGYMHDLQCYTTAQVLDFFKTFYTPNNMIAAVVGDVNVETVKQLAEKYFGSLPNAPLPPRPQFLEPAQRGERRVIVELDAEPKLIIGFHAPTYPDRDNLILFLINHMLVTGKSSRLYKELVLKEQLAQNIYGSTEFPGARYPGLFIIFCEPRFPHTATELEPAIYSQLELLKKEPVPAKEIEKIINQLEASFVENWEDNISIALAIVRSVIINGDIDFKLKRLQSLRTITPREIQETAKKYLNPSNRVVGILLKKENGGRAK
jgi:predicted Zn-dependent peptidase